MDTGFFIDFLEETLRHHGRPEILNTDHSAQLTSLPFTQVLGDAEVAISPFSIRDGRGRALDNVFVERLWRSVKWEDIDPKGYKKLPKLLVALFIGLSAYFPFYNGERPHQGLGYRTPDDVHVSGNGGGLVVDDHPPAESSARLRSAPPTTPLAKNWSSANPLQLNWAR